MRFQHRNGKLCFSCNITLQTLRTEFPYANSSALLTTRRLIAVVPTIIPSIALTSRVYTAAALTGELTRASCSKQINHNYKSDLWNTMLTLIVKLKSFFLEQRAHNVAQTFADLSFCVNWLQFHTAQHSY